MLTVLEPCDSEYRVRALLLWPRQGVTSLLIGDIRVPAAASYPCFRSFSFFFFFNLFTFCSPPFFPFSSLSLLSSSLGSALISRRLWPPSFAFQVAALCGRSPPSRRHEKRERGGSRSRCATVDASSPRSIPTSGAAFFSHELQCVINRINLGPNFLMIAVLMYVNECSLLTHYRQFA